MKYRILVFLWLVIFFNQQIIAQQNTELFVFGNSTINHEFTTDQPATEELKVPHWMFLLSATVGNDFACGGMYGFLPQFASGNLFSQWGFDLVDGVWDSDIENFNQTNITDVMITGANFIQWQAADQPYPTDPDLTPLSATQSLIDWIDDEKSDAQIYIYENWPDMAPYLGSGFPPNIMEWQNYQSYSQNDFHNWWLDYHDRLMQANPDERIRLIPVGYIISKLLDTTPYNSVSINELYEDDAPHGRPSIYFLAGLISYMAIYQEEAPTNFSIPNTVHETIRTNYGDIVDFIWMELNAFSDADGNSLVFLDQISNNADVSLDAGSISLFPNPTTNQFTITGNLSNYQISILDSQGNTHQTYSSLMNDITIQLTDLPNGLYFIQIQHLENGDLFFQKILKE